MKTTLWIYMQDNGDGSAAALFFNSEADANEYAEKAMEAFGQELCDNVYPQTLEFDSNGVLLNPDKWED